MGTWTGTNNNDLSRNASPTDLGLRNGNVGGFQSADGSDSIFGLGGNDILEGYGGGDLIEGGVGNDDIYGNNQLFDPVGSDTPKANQFPSAIDGDDNLYGQDGNDRIWGQEGADKLYGQVGDDKLFGGDGSDTMFGGAGIDTLSGGIGNDVLDGGAGADNLRGEAGDDSYTVTDLGDVVDEIGGTGNDSVYSSITFSLSNTAVVKGDVEKLVLFGTLAIDGFGNALNNVVGGNSATNRLEGLGGSDVLRGLGGNDNLLGGADNDTLYGGLGDDIVNGGAGSDHLLGEAGNDIYAVESAGDIVDENGGSGTDIVHSTISFNLANTAKVRGDVERLSLSGTAAISGTGNALANVMAGNDGSNFMDGGLGNDVIRGKGANDVLVGGVGIDTLTGDAGNDFFIFNAPLSAASRDVITDFSNVAGNNDTFRLENGVMPGLGAPGPLSAAAFFVGTAAHDASDRIIYNQTTGALFYDSNGNGAGGSTQLATLTTKPALTVADFAVI